MTIAGFLSKTFRTTRVRKSKLTLVVSSCSLSAPPVIIEPEMLLVSLLDALLVCGIESMML